MKWYRNLISQKSKIFASFPKGEALGRSRARAINPNLSPLSLRPSFPEQLRKEAEE